MLRDTSESGFHTPRSSIYVWEAFRRALSLFASANMNGHSNPLHEAVAAGSSGGSVLALVALIVSAAKSIEEEYAKSSAPSVPSLDDLTPHPLDSQIPSAALQQATQILEGACAQLCATVARPKRTMENVSSP